MADSETIKRTAQALETALSNAKTAAMCLLEAAGDDTPPWVSFHYTAIDALETAALDLITALNRQVPQLRSA